uniref:Zinc finger, CCHC-type n=1 Tax=Tanacetum cinerariifolium TaxID=118510 RepID=A0A6L2KSS5_TANCI|nr:zinc finger, CCHC-type [Tanacetum cinerariifolium]
MPILNELITADIQEEQYYKEYLEKMAKHQRYLAGEEGSDPDSHVPKPAKATEKSKPSTHKADLWLPVTKPALSQQPKPKPTPAKAVEESLKSVYDAPQGSLPPVIVSPLAPNSNKGSTGFVLDHEATSKGKIVFGFVGFQMTTSVINNSVFKGFFEKQKLNGPNFIDWYRQLRIGLSVEDKLNYLEHPIHAALVPHHTGQQVAPEALAAQAAWVKGSKEIVGLMLMIMDSKIQRNLENLGAYEMLQELKTLFAQQAEKRNNKLAYAPKPNIPPPPKREDPAKDSICHQCGETSHWKRKCPHYLAELLKSKKLSQGASGSSIFTIELYIFPNKSWVYDTGCGTHICNTTQGLMGSRKLKPDALSLYVGNGQRVVVEAIGSYHVSLPSGLVIVLNNCHYAPSITRGIILVSRLYDDGYVNRFVDNSI